MKFHKKHSLQQSFRAFDTFIKTKNPEGDRKHLNIETKRIFNKADSMTMELNSANIKPNKLQLSLLDEEDKEFDEFNEFNQAQKFNVERKFKQLNQTSNNVLPAQRVGGAKTSKNLFTKLKKFFI